MLLNDEGRVNSYETGLPHTHSQRSLRVVRKAYIHNQTVHSHWFLLFITITYSLLRQFHSVFKSQFSTQCDLMFPLSVTSIIFFIKVIQQLLMSSPSSSRHFYPSINSVFQKAVSSQSVTNPVSLPSSYCIQDTPPPPRLIVTLTPSSHYQSNRSSPSFSSTTLQNFPGISDPLSEVSKFQHHSELCPKCSTLLVSSLQFSLLCWLKDFASC